MTSIDVAPRQISNRNSPTRLMWARLKARPIGLASGIGLLVILLLAVFAPLIAPYDPAEINLLKLRQPPSFEHWLGTDEIGRDVLSRILYGARVAVLVVVVSTGLALVVGLAIGIVSGYFGGWVDSLIMRITDGLLAFPTLILALGIVAALGPSMVNALLAIAIVNVPNFARFARGEVLALRQADFIQAARAIGLPRWRILIGPIRRHLMPSMLVYATLKGSVAIITESSLSFLGLGAQPPTPTWGAMISTGLQQMNQAWWLPVIPGMALFITILLLNFFGDAMRDVLDTKLADDERSR